MAARLYRIASGQDPAASFPIRLVQDPGTVRAILTDHAAFPKNYDFLSTLAEGRFTANDPDWARRAKLTQPSYARALGRVDYHAVVAIYGRHLADQAGPVGEGLHRALTDAALAVVSQVLGLRRPIAWDQVWLVRVRRLLALRQWVGFVGTRTDHLAQIDQGLVALRREILDLWGEDAELQALLDSMAQRGRDIPGFDAGEELIQNIIASSETTAASLMWAVNVLANRPALAVWLREGGDPERERFIAELLRRFPPVPFVTRYSRHDCTIGARTFAAGEPLAISFVGLHCDPGEWSRPLEFDPARDEWAPGAPSPASYFPFSTGARVCGGLKIARAELRAGLEVLISTFDIHAGPTPGALSYGLSLRPIADAVLVERRRS
ncbi:hypothetical protein BH10PSE3_BH10PSE3_01990 [soil metagenome]